KERLGLFPNSPITEHMTSPETEGMPRGRQCLNSKEPPVQVTLSWLQSLGLLSSVLSAHRICSLLVRRELRKGINGGVWYGSIGGNVTLFEPYLVWNNSILRHEGRTEEEKLCYRGWIHSAPNIIIRKCSPR